MKTQHKNSSLKLQFQFDPQQLVKDLDTCLEMNWKMHFNQNDFDGEWTGIALRSSSGNEVDLQSHPGVGFLDTPLLNSCPYFQKTLSQLHCEKETVRLLRLAPGSIIKEHRDLGTGYQFGNFRLHICIITNPDISFIVDQKELVMHPGECWYADFDRPHSVTNRGNNERIHLIIDCIRNEWSDGIFKEAGYDFSLENLPRDESTHQRIIEELQRLNTETSKKLIHELNQKRNGI